MVYEHNVFDSMSTFFTVPTTLASPYTTPLKVCATTKEMRTYGEKPKFSEFRELEDSFTVIKLPALPTGFDTSVRSITNTAPDFLLERGKSGDFYYLSPTTCHDQRTLIAPLLNSYPPNTAPSQTQHHLPTRTGLSAPPK